MLEKLQKSEFVAFALAAVLAPLSAIVAAKLGLSEALVSQMLLGILGSAGFYGAQRAYAKPREMQAGGGPGAASPLPPGGSPSL